MGPAAVVGAAVSLAALVVGVRVLAGGLAGRAGDAVAARVARVAGGPGRAFAVGLLATAVLQSSSATTVVALTLAQAGTLPGLDAAWFIMGANVGTTLTAQLAAFSTPELGKAAVAGGLLLLAAPRAWRRWSPPLLGLGLLFLGLDGLGRAGLAALDTGAASHWLLTAARRPLAGLVAGVAVTTVLDSSSVTLGLVQGLTRGGVLTLEAAVPVIMGANVGTTTATLVAGLALGRAATRLAAFHLGFNLVGGAVFMAGRGLLAAAAAHLAADPARQVAHAHTLFNAATAALVAPGLAWLGRRRRQAGGARRGTGRPPRF